MASPQIGLSLTRGQKEALDKAVTRLGGTRSYVIHTAIDAADGLSRDDLLRNLGKKRDLVEDESAKVASIQLRLPEHEREIADRSRGRVPLAAWIRLAILAYVAR